MSFIDLLNSAASDRIGLHITRPLATGACAPDLKFAAVFAAAGVRVERPLKLQRNGRCVFLVRHPKWGRCVLKTVDPIAESKAGLSNFAIARFIAENPSPIFPAIYSINAQFTLEEYIEGITFRSWVEQAFEIRILAEYLTELKRWSLTRGPWPGGDTLLPDEIKEIMSSYVQKCVRQTRYQRTGQKIRCMLDLRRKQTELRSLLERLSDRAESLRLPRGMMCGDMSNVNLMVDTRRKRIFTIDYEFLGPGHVGFDCAYLLAAVEKLPMNPAAAAELSAHVHSADFAGAPDRAAFFSDYGRVLTEISQTVYGPRFGKTRPPAKHRRMDSAEAALTG